MLQTRLRFLAVSVATLLTVSCGDSIETDIDRLYDGGPDAGEAVRRLNRAKPIDTIALIDAFRDTEHPPFVKLVVAEALHQLYLREENRRVLFTLIEGIADPDARVRTAVAKIIKQTGPVEAVGPLINQLVGETNERVRYAILDALEEISVEDGPIPFSWQLNTGLLASEARPNDKLRFTRTLQQMQREQISDSLKAKSLEWLEILAEEAATEAWGWFDKGDRQWAEKQMLAARDMVPQSKNLSRQLGHFYLTTGKRQQGLRILRSADLLISAIDLPTRPIVDGLLTDSAWNAVRPQTQFYRCLWSRLAQPDSGRSEFFVGHFDGDLYVGYRAFESSTEGLTAEVAAEDDEAIARDDGIELFLDVNHDLTTYYHVAANSLGTIVDQFNAGSGRQGDLTWNGGVEAKATVADTEWSLELRIPAHKLANSRIAAGNVWGFNVGRVRTIGDFAYAQWAPTFGSAHRPDRFGYLLFD